MLAHKDDMDQWEPGMTWLTFTGPAALLGAIIVSVLCALEGDKGEPK
jgi:hypothetical protein